jgi:flagellar L-ring protein precursor FlgH
MKTKKALVVGVAASSVAASVWAQVAQNAQGVPNAQVAQATVAPTTIAPADVIPHSGGSLMRAGAFQPVSPEPRPGQTRMDAVSLYAVPAPAPREIKKHALLTIVIREESQASSQAKADATKETSLDAHLDQYVKLTSKLYLDQINNPLSIQSGTKQEFKGDGQADRSDSFVTRIGAEVVDVKPNGTLVLQARKHIKLDEEEQDYVLSGVCRVEDVSIDNTVLSTQLHDLDLTKTTKGIVRDATKRGLFTRFLDFVNPF